MPNNRVILLTPEGGAAIAVVRLAGPNVEAFLLRHFAKPPVSGRCVHGDLRDGERVIDDAVVVLSDNRAFADVSVHGGPWVVRAVLELAQREGFDLAENRSNAPTPGCVDGDTELEREVMAWLPMARTEVAVRALLGQLSSWRAIQASGTVDAAVIDRILADRGLYWLLNPPRVAIIGSPNVGKSTLANQLFAQERSITADLPGTTRDWVGEIANIDGLAVMLVDTPGLRQTADDIERAAIEKSAEQVRQADLVIVVLDATQPFAGQSHLLTAHSHAIRVINKIDRPAVWDLESAGGIRTVATTGTGVDELRREIRGRFGCEAVNIHRPQWWTKRQRELLGRATGDPQALRGI